MQTKQYQTVLIGGNLSNKHELALYKTQKGEPKFFFFNFARSYLYKKLQTDIPILQSWLAGWWMYCVALRLYDIKKLQSPLNTYTIKIHLADIFYLFVESPPSIFPL